MEVILDIESLRKDLIDYFGSAMTCGFGMAVIDVVRVQRACDEELLYIAKKCNFDLNNYVVKVLKF
jgi:hypothetical protein